MSLALLSLWVAAAPPPPAQLDLDLTLARVNGVAHIAQLPDARLRVELTEVSTGALSLLEGPRFEGLLSPGKYRVHVTWSSEKVSAPARHMGEVLAKSGLVVPPKGLQNLDFGLRVAPVAGTLRVDGAEPTCSPITDVVFVDEAALRSKFEVACGADGFSGFVAAGTYRVDACVHLPGGIGVPCFTVEPKVRVEAGVGLKDLRLSLTTAQVAGRVRFNGRKPRVSRGGDRDPNPCALVQLRDAYGNGAAAEVSCRSEDFTFQTRLPIGTYRARLLTTVAGPEVLDTDIPMLEMPVIGSVVVPKEGLDAIDANAMTVEVSGNVDLGRKLQPGLDCNAEVARVELVSADATFIGRLACGPRAGRFSLQAAPGTYAVWVQNASFDRRLAQAALTVPARGLRDQTVKTKLFIIEGTVKLTGALTRFPGSCEPDTHIGRADLVDALDVDKAIATSLIVGCRDGKAFFTAEVAPGSYRLHLRLQEPPLDTSRLAPAPTFDVGR